MGQSNYVHLEDCEVLWVTDKAILIRWLRTNHWIPRGQIANHETLQKGLGYTVSITEWIASQKGITTQAEKC